MGLRLSLGIGPLRATLPVTTLKRRRGAGRSRARTFHGTVRARDGSTYTCHHEHPTEQAAAECAAKYLRSVGPPAPVPTPSGAAPPPPWWPRTGWGTVRDYRIYDNGNGRADIFFKFVPDDGTEPRLVRLADTLPLAGLGEYARGILHRQGLTVKVSAEAMASAERDTFYGINQLDLAERRCMFTDSDGFDCDCGWAWTPDYRLVKVAPGLLC